MRFTVASLPLHANAVGPLNEHQWLTIAKLSGIATQTVLQERATAKSDVVYISKPAAAH
jgi:hypothetical protein